MVLTGRAGYSFCVSRQSIASMFISTKKLHSLTVNLDKSPNQLFLLFHNSRIRPRNLLPAARWFFCLHSNFEHFVHDCSESLPCVSDLNVYLIETVQSFIMSSNYKYSQFYLFHCLINSYIVKYPWLDFFAESLRSLFIKTLLSRFEFKLKRFLFS